MKFISLIKKLKDIFVISSNTIILLLIINLLSIYVFNYNHNSRKSDRYSKLPNVVKANYSHLSKSEVNSILNTTWSGGWEYEEVLGFKERKRSSKFVNVNSFGFRNSTDLENFLVELNGAIWFFGGSNTFGYGLADQETIPSILGSYLDTKVVNLGRGHYFSEQENLLLMKLLKVGVRPSKVVFLDGINERCSIQNYQNEMKSIFFKAQKPHNFSDYLFNIVEPTISLLTKVANEFGLEIPKKDQAKNLHSINCKFYNKKIELNQVVNRNLKMRSDLCLSNNLDCLTVLQPFAGVHGQHLSFQDLNKSQRKEMKLMFSKIKPVFELHNALDVTGSLSYLNKHAFVDDVHYSFEANQLIARAIAKSFKKK